MRRMPFFLLEHLSPKISVHFTDSHHPLHNQNQNQPFIWAQFLKIKRSSKLYFLKAL